MVRSDEDYERIAAEKTPVTAWSLYGWDAWVGDYHAVPVNGRSRYEGAVATRDLQRVRMSYIKVVGRQIQQVDRWFEHDAMFVLVPIEMIEGGRINDG